MAVQVVLVRIYSCKRDFLKVSLFINKFEKDKLDLVENFDTEFELLVKLCETIIYFIFNLIIIIVISQSILISQEKTLKLL